MKVNITKRTKEAIRANQLEAAKAVVASCKEDESTVKEYAEMAARVLFDNACVQVYEATAEVAPNYRIYDAFGETGNLDVWIDFAAKSWDEFAEAGVYLSDLWSLSADNRDEVREKMYSVIYKRA